MKLLSPEEEKETPNYGAALRALEETYKWAKDGFPGATLEQMIQIATNLELEWTCAAIRLRADRNCGKLLKELLKENAKK